MKPQFVTLRKRFHAALLRRMLTIDASGVPSNADKCNRTSVTLAAKIAGKIGGSHHGEKLAGQMSGNRFEEICAEFIEASFSSLTHMRPGIWHVLRATNRNRLAIAEYEQYAHLIALDAAAKSNPELAAALGSDYTITPDIVICREPEEDAVINRETHLVDEHCTRLAPLRKMNNSLPILHASISCKWTIRSDRAQNTRSEALNLMRNRKGRLPHVMAVTAEPLPSRISSIALGTGDIDCVYHFALYELLDSVAELQIDDSAEMLKTMVEGRRLRDVSDLPLDLIV